MTVGFGWRRYAGLAHVGCGDWYLHIGIRRSAWIWGREDMLPWLEQWGAGPVFLLCRCVG